MTEACARSDLVVFVHIPKTAGTTLNALLAHHYSADQIYEIMMRGMSVTTSTPLISASKIRRLKRALKHDDELRVIHGHFDLSLGKLLPTRAKLVTLLRDPVERAISHYFHYRKMQFDPINPLAMRSSLSEWVGNCGLVEMDNGQTRRLAGDMDKPFGQVTQAMLERAKENLSRFSVVGLTERFEETQVLLNKTFDWPLYRYTPRNVSELRLHRSEVSDQDVRFIMDCNRFDMELYRFAAELLEQAVSRFNMVEELSALRNAPEHVEPIRTETIRVPTAYQRAKSAINTFLRSNQTQKLMLPVCLYWLSTMASSDSAAILAQL